MAKSSKQNEWTESIELNLGSRSVNKQGLHNKSIIIPKIALEGCGLKDAKKVQIKIVKTNKETFIKISQCASDSVDEKSQTSNNKHDFVTFNSNEKSKQYNNHNGDNKND
jgi:hypothetical protein